jgi:hypothetical protein
VQRNFIPARILFFYRVNFDEGVSGVECKVLLRHGQGRPLKPVKPAAAAFSHFTVLSEEEQQPEGRVIPLAGMTFLQMRMSGREKE